MAFELLARLGLNATGFQTGLKRAESSATTFATGIKSKLAAAFGAAAITSFIKSAVDAVDKIGDIADQTGLTTDEVQKLEKAFRLSGLSIDDAASAMAKLASTSRDALNGNAQLLSIFESLGVSVQDLKSLNPAEIFRKIGTALPRLSQADQTEALQSLLGRSGGRTRAAATEFAGASGGVQIAQEQVAQISKAKDEVAEIIKGAQLGIAALGAAAFNKVKNFFTTDEMRKSEKALADQVARNRQDKVQTLIRLVDPQSIKDAEEARKIYDELAKTQADFALSLLPAKEREAALQKRINDLLAESVKLNEEGEFLKAAQAQREAEQLKQGLQKAGPMDGLNQSQSVNQLQRIGAQVGGTRPKLENIMKQHLVVTKQIEKNTRGTEAFPA